MRFIARALIFCAMIALSGCGFHLRSAESIPPELRILYLQTPNPYSAFSTQLHDVLSALNIQLTDSPAHAPIILDVVATRLTHNDPAIQSTSAAINYTFVYSTTVELINAQGAIIAGPTTLVTRRVITLNSSQVINSSIGVSTSQQMIRQNVDKIYFWLISNNTRQALAKHGK